MPDSAYPTRWTKTSHSVKAKSDESAQKKVIAKFKGCGFSNMSLVAVEEGVDPNG